MLTQLLLYYITIPTQFFCQRWYVVKRERKDNTKKIKIKILSKCDAVGPVVVEKTP